MQLDAFAEPGGVSGRTSPGRSARTTDETLLLWLARWLAADSIHRPMDGVVPVLLSAREGWSSGACWTRSSSDWHSAASVCSLSSILETGKVARRFYLSPKACAGILRRAEKRGRELPAHLRQALSTAAAHVLETAATD